MGKQHMSNHLEESSGSYMTMHMTFKYIFALLMNQNGLTDSCQISIDRCVIAHKPIDRCVLAYGQPLVMNRKSRIGTEPRAGCPGLSPALVTISDTNLRIYIKMGEKTENTRTALSKKKIARPEDINGSRINEKEIKRELDGPLVRAVRARPVGDVAAREWAMESVTCSAVVLLENSEIEIKNKNQKIDGDGDGEALISKSISSNRKPTLRLLSFTGVGDLFISVGELPSSFDPQILLQSSIHIGSLPFQYGENQSSPKPLRIVPILTRRRRTKSLMCWRKGIGSGLDQARVRIPMVGDSNLRACGLSTTNTDGLREQHRWP
ncbi:LOW QUALITY PROTEIN: hypothetical protein YC2023_014734 [Brassica napus]